MNALVGKRLKALRTRRGLSQRAVAELVSISRSAVSAIERGVRRVSPAELVAMTEKLGEDLDYFTNPFRLVDEGAFSWRISSKSGKQGCVDQKSVSG